MDFLSEQFIQLGGTVVVCMAFIWYLNQKDHRAQEAQVVHQKTLDRIVADFKQECAEQRKGCAEERKQDREAFEKRVIMVIQGFNQ